jgi:hypothetical protein
MEMDELAMIEALNEHWRQLLLIIASFPIGVVLGIAYFHAVRRSAEVIVTGKRAGLALALIGGRVVVMIVALVGLLQFGAWPLVSAAAGIYVGRGLVLRASKREAP